MYQGLILILFLLSDIRFIHILLGFVCFSVQKDATLYLLFAVTMQVISPQRSAIQHIKSAIFLLFTFLHQGNHLPVYSVYHLRIKRLQISHRHPNGRVPQRLAYQSHRYTTMISKCSPCMACGVRTYGNTGQ